MGGIWITDSVDGDPIPKDLKYLELWETAKTEIYNKTKAELSKNYLAENNMEYDEKNQSYVSKELNPDWPYKALYIDTINYNYWERMYDQLYNLKQRYESLPDETPKTDSEVPKTKDGKKYDPWCERFYPLDYSKIFRNSYYNPSPVILCNYR